MRRRKLVVLVVSVAMGLPVGLILSATASYYALMSSYAPNFINGALVSSGQKREYLLHVSSRYNRDQPTPLVISLHGAASWPST